MAVMCTLVGLPSTKCCKTSNCLGVSEAQGASAAGSRTSTRITASPPGRKEHGPWTPALTSVYGRQPDRCRGILGNLLMVCLQQAGNGVGHGLLQSGSVEKRQSAQPQPGM